MPRPFPAEFRLRAVALVRAGKTITRTAQELGVSQAALHGWVHVMVIHRPHPQCRAHALLRHGWRRTRQRNDGVVLVEHADRTTQPQEMEDESRTFERHVRLHRDFLQPPTTTLRPQLRVADRVRINIESPTQDCLIVTLQRVTKPWGRSNG